MIGIPDYAEEADKTFYGMPLYDWSARKNQRDVFVEVDYMPVHTLRDYDGNVMNDSNGNPIQDHSIQPTREVFDKLKQIYAAEGYHMHFDVGNLFDRASGLDPNDYDLGGGQAVPYGEYIHLSRWTDTYNGQTINVPGMVEDYVPQYLEGQNPNRARLFYYVMFANSQGGGNRSSSGIAPDLLDRYAIVTLGGSGWRPTDISTANKNMLINVQASTFLHKLGHVLGFSHGGFPTGNIYNFKPNYISAMNYLHQLQGTPKTYSDYSLGNMITDRYQINKIDSYRTQLQSRHLSNYTWGNLIKGFVEDPSIFNIDYSRDQQAEMNEATMKESSYYGGLDFNRDGTISASTVSYDLSGDNSITVLQDHNDWANLTLYYRYLNFSGGRYLIGPNPLAKNATKPSDVIGGAAPEAPPQYQGPQEVGVQEWVPPQAFIDSLRELQQH